MSFGVLVQAEFEDGFVLTEDQSDQSLYEEGRNTFFDILHGLPEAEHGRMVRFSAITAKRTYSVDWRELWDVANPRPIYYREMERDADGATGEWLGPPRALRHFFGSQYNDAFGRNVQKVQEIGA